MTDARQDDEFGSASATRELASQPRFVLHLVDVSDNDRGRDVDVANQIADVERHTLQARFAASVPPKVSSVTCFRNSSPMARSFRLIKEMVMSVFRRVVWLRLMSVPAS
jgi:hypothetical protein